MYMSPHNVYINTHSDTCFFDFAFVTSLPICMHVCTDVSVCVCRMTEYRYIRKVHPTVQPTDQPQEQQADVFENEVEWLRPFKANIFFRLDSNFSLRNHPLFVSGAIVGMDSASVATVWALKLGKSDTCLDMCCAPGMKMALIHELVENVFGIDINETRLFVCRKLFHKFGVKSPNLFLKISDDRLVHFETFIKSKRVKKQKKRKAQSLNRPLHDETPTLPHSFDKVLVDVECTHDGSDRHSQKFSNEENPTYNTKEKMEKLIELQKKLLIEGYHLCKPGGIIVYSTCSLQSRQNEQIVNHLFAQFPNDVAHEDLPWVDCNNFPATMYTRSSCLFEPHISKTSGQFIAAIRKLHERSECVV